MVNRPIFAIVLTCLTLTAAIGHGGQSATEAQQLDTDLSRHLVALDARWIVTFDTAAAAPAGFDEQTAYVPLKGGELVAVGLDTRRGALEGGAHDPVYAGGWRRIGLCRGRRRGGGVSRRNRCNGMADTGGWPTCGPGVVRRRHGRRLEGRRRAGDVACSGWRHLVASHLERATGRAASSCRRPALRGAEERPGARTRPRKRRRDLELHRGRRSHRVSSRSTTRSSSARRATTSTACDPKTDDCIGNGVSVRT